MIDQVLSDIDQAITAALAKRWWLFVVRGLLGIVLAILAFTSPADTLATLVLVFGIFTLFDGILSIFGSVAAAELREPWWPLELRGVLGIAAGIYTFARPEMTALVLVYVIALWAIAGGALEIVTAFEFHDAIQHAWLLVVGGLASIVFGGLAIATPGAGAMALVGIFGFYAAVYGVVYVVFGFQLLGVSRRTSRGQRPTLQPRPSAAAA
jgi:uncharacterized membrane protein HdeD (DUF308 family)